VNDFKAFLQNRGVSDVDDLMQHIHEFIENPELYFELLTRRLNSRSSGISNLGMFEVFHNSLRHSLKLSQMR
jgi:hypothetical protein